MIIPKELIEEAKVKLGDRAAFLIAKDLSLEQFDEKNLKSLCKWHAEDTPSLIWNDKGNFFKCFGCGKVYGILDHYMVFNNLTYLESVQRLFEQVGVDYKFGERGVKGKEYKYPQYTPDDNRLIVENYFSKRRISPETLDYFDVKQYDGKVAWNFYNENDVLETVKLRHPYKPSAKESKEWFLPNYDNKSILFGMNKVDPTKPLLITEGQCLTGDAEVLTPLGWVRLDEYSGQQVLQVDKDMSANFTIPIAYIKKQYDDNLFVAQGVKTSYYSAVTKDHNLVYFDYKNRLTKRRVDELPLNMGDAKIPTAVFVNGGGIPLTNDQIALYLAISADATIDARKDGTRHSRFGVKKDRKYIRLKGILDRLNITYFDNPISNGTGIHNIGKYKYLGFKTPDWIQSKELPIEWVQLATIEQKRFIIDEMVFWDGNKVKGRTFTEFSTTSENNADFMQIMASTSGIMSSKRIKCLPTTEHKTRYNVKILHQKSHISMQHNLFIEEKYSGLVYCVTVPTGMFLVRQKDKISVTGNCDTMAVFEAGYSNVVSIPGGTENKKWIEECWNWLEQFDKIILWFDNDIAGVKSRKEVASRLGTWRTLYVDLPPVLTTEDGKTVKCKDANEVLYFFGKDKIISLLDGAQEIPVSGVVNLSDVSEFNLEEADGLYTHLQPLDDIVYKFLMGSVVVLTGKRGSGKSSLANQIFASEGLNQGYDIFYYSGELDPRVLRSWIDLNLAGEEKVKEDKTGFIKIIDANARKEISDWYNGRVWIYDNNSNKAKDILDSGINVTRKYGSRIWILDNLMMMDLDSDGDLTSTLQKQKEFIVNIVKIAQTYNILIVLVIHPRKVSVNQSDLIADDVSGSGDLTNMAQYVVSARRFTQKEKDGVPDGRGGYKKDSEPIPYDVAVEVLKNRYTGRQGTAMLNFNYSDYRFYSSESERTKRYKWNKDMTKYKGRERKEEEKDFFMD